MRTLRSVLFCCSEADEALRRGIQQFEIEQPGFRAFLISHGDGRWVLMFDDDQERTDLSDAEWKRVLDVNTNAVFWCGRAFGRHMVEKRSGAMVNIGSMSGIIVNKGFSAAHCMVSKAGVHQITKALAVEWAGVGVRAKAIAPGYTITSQTELLRSRPEHHQACLDTTPLGRFAQPVEIASAVLFLASDACSYCTNTVLTVDGGHTCW